MIIKEIVEQHADNLFYLWTQRDAATLAPNYNLTDLANLDERVEANYQGLALGKDYGWELCEKALEDESPGEVFGAALFALDSQDMPRIQTVIDFVADNHDYQRAFISALGWLPFKKVSPILEQLIESTSPAKKRLGIGGLTKHRMDPGEVLTKLIADSDVFLKSRAIEAAGELGRVDVINQIMKTVNHDDDLTRFASCWSLGRLGAQNTAVINGLKSFCEPGFLYCDRSVSMLTNVLPLKACHEWIEKLIRDDNTCRLGIIAIRELGDPIHIPVLFEYMTKEDLARICGEAFSWISGIDLEYDNFESNEPKGFEAGPTDDPDDENVDSDIDEDLFWPDVEKLHKWWDKNVFSSHTRYLRGKEVSPAQYRRVLIEGNQRQRISTALRLAISSPEDVLYEVRAPGKLQQQELSV